MKRQLFFASILALGVGIAQAQTGNPTSSGSSPQTGTASPGAANTKARQQAPGDLGTGTGSGAMAGSAASPANMASQSSVQGCVGGSEGNWALTTDDGKTVKLIASKDQLPQYSGEEVQIDGTPASDGSLQVQSVKKVSETCSRSNQSSKP